jgi:hypothetical protein
MKFQVDTSNTFEIIMFRTKMSDGRTDGRRLFLYPPPPFRRGIINIQVQCIYTYAIQIKHFYIQEKLNQTLLYVVTPFRY